MAVKGAKALEVWARRVTDGYPNVRVRDMSRSWKDGLAFCAILHKFRPDLLDFYSLDQTQIERNCTTVFRIAEEALGIPSLLDPVDMAECESPDRLSILTYLSEFYHTFKAEKSPPVTVRKEVVLGEERAGSSELKRKDSCDSGVSVSPLGSVCNSPPPSKKENSPEPSCSPPRHLPPSPAPAPAGVAPSVDAREVTPVTSPVTPSPDLDSLLRQRLNISLAPSGSPLSRGLAGDSSEKERRSLLKSMISVSGSDVGRNPAGQETSNVPDSQPDRAHRRRSLDPSFLSQKTLRASQTSETPSQAAARGFVSCTRISLTPSNPVKYARNNSVTCDVKNTPTTSQSPLRPWRESNSCKNSSVPAAGGGTGERGHRQAVQVKVNSGQDSHSESFKSKMMKFERMMGAGAGGSWDDSGVSGSEERRRVNLTCNQENNRFPSAVQQPDPRRKSISFSPSFTVSLASSEDPKLTF